MDLELDLARSFAFFHFELLFAALHAAQAPEEPPSNSVKRQVRHKLIMGRLRVIALGSHGRTSTGSRVC